MVSSSDSRHDLRYSHYRPAGDGGLGNETRNGWQPYYTEAGGFISTYGNSAAGESLHITALAGSSFWFQFYGASAYPAYILVPSQSPGSGQLASLYGTANCSFDVAIDGNSTTLNPADGLLYQSGTLDEQQLHNFSLVAHATVGNAFSFDRVDVTRSHLPQDG